jgi:hypothetical protein
MLVFIGLAVTVAVYIVRIGAQLIGLPSFLIPAKAAGSFLLFSLAIAVLTMSFIQICRILIPVRGWFQGRSLFLWFSSAIDERGFENDLNPFSQDVLGAWNQLLHITKPPSVEKALAQFRQARIGKKASYISGIFGAQYPLLYDLPLEQLSAQIALATDLAMDKPRDYSDLLLCVVGIEGAPELVAVFTSTAEQSSYNEENSKRRALQDAQARGTISRLIQRRSDKFQIDTGGRWRRNLRMVVTACSITFSSVVVLSNIGRGESLIKWCSYVAYGIFGGGLAAFMAMLLRDITAIIENRRRQL